MTIHHSPRLRPTRLGRLASLPLHLDTLESRLLLSSAAIAPAKPAAVPANVAPTIHNFILSANKVSINTLVDVDGTFVDPNAGDTHTVTVDWGDQSLPSVHTLAAGAIAFGLSTHVYTANGLYAITTTVTDQGNLSATRTDYIGVADPHDLVPSIINVPNLFKTLIIGDALTGTITVRISNDGIASATGATVSVYLHPNAGGPDINITNVPHAIPNLPGVTIAHLIPLHETIIKDAFHDLPINVTLPLNLAAGDYSIVAKITDFSTNNTATDDDFTLNAAVGFFSLSTSLALLNNNTGAFTIGTPLSPTVTFTFANNGNIPSASRTVKPQYSVQILLQPSAGPNIPLVTLPHISIPYLSASGNPITDSKTVGAKLFLPAAVANSIPPGTYNLIASFTPIGTTIGTPFLVTGPQVTFSLAAHAGFLKHGDTLKFTATTELTGANFVEYGRFSTHLQVTGSYAFSPAGLVLTYDTGGTDTLAFTFTGTPGPLDPHVDANATTIIFSTDPTSAFASILLTGSTQSLFAKLG